MANLKKILSPIVVVSLLIVLPVGSYFYLYSGSLYYKENMAMLVPKSNLPDFTLFSHNGDTLSAESLKGHASVISFFSSTCDENCKNSLRELQRVQAQFFKTDRVKLLSITTEPLRDSLNYLRNIATSNQAENSFWHFSTFGDVGPTKDFVKKAFKGFSGKQDLSKFILVDDSLNVRRYYDGTSPDSVDLLIRHLSMVMPKEKKKGIVYDPEKEK